MRRDLRRLVTYLRACVGTDEAGACWGPGAHTSVAKCNETMTRWNRTCANPREHHRARPRWRSVGWWVS